MHRHTAIRFETLFEEEVYKGLTDFPKHLSSKYFYDEKGDKLFQDIMAMPEYYLTDAEFSIFENHTEEITTLFRKQGGHFNLIELGAGDGKKTKILLNHLSQNGADFTYQPIDISQNVLNGLKASLAKELPDVPIQTKQGTYFEALNELNGSNTSRKVILFLGSNIGNLLHDQAIEFLKQVRALMQEEDLLFLGVDQKKNPQTILDAYNDKTGITAAFNKNILSRINAELGGDFDVDQFLHWEVYDPESGTAKSYLVSKKEQTVTIGKLDFQAEFGPWETIHTEISQKYDDRIIMWLAEKSGLQVETEFTDSKKLYKNYVLRKAY
ncbi:L-histidine N(alpha)-methyltransferase [Aggregatimonas sangjinii]|uniref:L-histidine N(Alpha)-methyltransferase n=1 Tax=Aggregatimonas sangjinii TaxID=2583587 RepID=A0A5B7SKB6_9FLAO|nr:L-histidine N(alpha)-methyltransferase [Aggregatimonas sangjinii]QCW98944.1 L-histidine N(alpha)-methyltransferase [Aggregatimonas sangjinii]